MFESGSSDPSIVLWFGAAVVIVLGARVFIEYLRRVNYEGPMHIWREWLTGATALMLGIWAAMIVGITAQNITFAIGYHPARLFGGLIFAWLLAVVVMYWVTLKPGLWGLVSACGLSGVITLLLEISVVWSLAGPTSRIRSSAATSATRLVDALAVALNSVAVTTSTGSGTSAPRSCIAAITARASSTSAGSARLLPIGSPCGEQEGVGDAAADDQAIDLGGQALQHQQLGRDLAAGDDRDQRSLRLGQRLCDRVDLGGEQRAGDRRAARTRRCRRSRPRRDGRCRRRR